MKKTNIRKTLKKHGFVIYNFHGTSMLPLLKEKEDKVHLKANEKIKLFDVVLFERYKGYFVLHRVIDIKDGKCYILGDNSPILDIVPLNEIVAKMVGYYKKNIYHDINSEEYLSYVEKIKKSINPIKEELIKDSKEFFYLRKKNAYYQVLRYALKKEVDGDLILRFEKTELIEYCQNKKALPALGMLVFDKVVDLSPSLNKYVLDSLNEAKFRYLRSEEAVKKLTESFSSYKIPHIFLKGSDIRNEYPFPYLRVSNDIDLLVKPSDFKKAKEILIKEFGGEFFATTQHDESYVCKKIMMDVELHHHINTDLPEDVMWVCEDIFKNATKDPNSEYRFHASDEMSKVINLSHSAKHLNGGEFWATMLWDFRLLNKKKISEKVLIDSRLVDYSKTLEHYTDFIFDKKELNETEKEFERFIFKNKGDTYISLSKGKYKTKFAYIMNRIFLPYRYFAPKHKALQKCPFLLPFYEIARWVKAPFKKGGLKHYKNEMDNYINANENEIKALTDAGLKEYIVKYEDHKTRF